MNARTRRYRAKLQSLATAPKRGTFFRSIDLQYMTSPLSAVGSILEGGRYNHLGDFEVLYLADTQQTTLFETKAVYNHSGKVVGRRQPPRAMLSVDLELQVVLDLTSPDLQKALGVTLADLRAPWQLAQEEGRPIITQDIGAAARAANIEALLYPSAVIDDAVNIAIIVDRLRVGSHVTLYTDPMSAAPRVGFSGTYVPSPRARR